MELLTLIEVAEALKMSKRNIMRLVENKNIPKPFKISRSLRWNRHEIEEWISAGCPKESENNKT